jgi:hypothetical protein
VQCGWDLYQRTRKDTTKHKGAHHIVGHKPLIEAKAVVPVRSVHLITQTHRKTKLGQAGWDSSNMK